MQYRRDKRYPCPGGKPVHGGKTVFLSLVPALQGHGTGKIPECHPKGNAGIVLLLNHSFRKTTACETQARDFSHGFLTQDKCFFLFMESSFSFNTCAS